MKRRSAPTSYGLLLVGALGFSSAVGCGKAYRDCHRLRTCEVPEDGGAGSDGGSSGGAAAGGKLGSSGAGGANAQGGIIGEAGAAATSGAPAGGGLGVGGETIGGAGPGGVGAGGADGACQVGTSRCEGNAAVTCSADGIWNPPMPCDGATPICHAGACMVPPSCTDLPTSCGASSDESCCESPLVTGGAFYRSYDGITPEYSAPSYPARISDFRLDKYEITVGRFRKFIAAWLDGWRPASGAGKHEHLNDGMGIGLSGGGYELGWNSEWLSPGSPTYAAIASNASDWNTNLQGGTWTSSPGAHEQAPIVGTTWYENYAFCIWDGGFLPTEAEWNYAASGGDQQRVFAWGNEPPANDTNLAIYNCLYGSGNCDASTSIAPVGYALAGAGRYGQLDLAGNAWEWVLDWHADYEPLCIDCAQLNFAEARMYRGGSFYDVADKLLASFREYYPPRQRSVRIGARCAREP